jgi:hypothetical protein
LREHGASTVLLRELDEQEKADNTLDLTMFEDGEENGFENYPTEDDDA